MANLVTPGVVGRLADIHTVQQNQLGLRARDEQGNEYVYLAGIASTVAGSVVTYGLATTNAYVSALSVAGARGPVAFACAAILAVNWGWYQIYGLVASANFNGAAVVSTLLFSASTGKCDDAVVTGDRIEHATVAATVSGSGVATNSVWCAYPYMNGNG